jgi:hypothetical protein
MRFGSVPHINCGSQKRFSEILMENHVMSDPTKLQIKIFGISINAEGAIGIGAAVFIVLAILISNRL